MGVWLPKQARFSGISLYLARDVVIIHFYRICQRIILQCSKVYGTALFANSKGTTSALLLREINLLIRRNISRVSSLCYSWLRDDATETRASARTSLTFCGQIVWYYGFYLHDVRSIQSNICVYSNCYIEKANSLEMYISWISWAFAFQDITRGISFLKTSKTHYKMFLFAFMQITPTC